MNTILVVEDDRLIGNAVEQWLGKDNRVTWVQTLQAARSELSTGDFDIVILDLGLPDGHGLELLKFLKRSRNTAGVLIMTAYGESGNRIEGLDQGADDYLVKPIDFKELDARIRAVKRRKDGLHSSIIEHGNLTLDINASTVTLAGAPVHLSRKEFSILSVLLQGRNRYFSKTMLEERIYPVHTEFEGNAIEVHISSLRKKLGKSLIKTTRGLGYIIEQA